MARISSTLEIVSTASKLFTCICDIPVLSPLKPLGSILVTICDHVAALEGNKEAAIVLAARVNRAVQVLVNRARDFDGAMPGSYFDDIKILEKSRTTQAIDPLALRVYTELDATESCSVQVGTYNKQAVVVRKYYTANEKARIILLYAEDLVFCNRDLDDTEDIRRPWRQRRIGPPIPSKSSSGGATISVQTLAPSATPGKESSTPSGILAVKESDVLLRQLASVMRFLEKMDVMVDWWKFKVKEVPRPVLPMTLNLVAPHHSLLG
ncbi:hypothetical protein FRC00_001811 [Tulasnella sp. 408]|nr:hypothetical protein FRC00_001811 [Tulasnella sp. 408]